MRLTYTPQPFAVVTEAAIGMQGSMRWALFTLSAVGFAAVAAVLFQLLQGQVTGVLQQNLKVAKPGFEPYEERRQCAPV